MEEIENAINEHKEIYEGLYDILSEYNSKFNLTAIKSKEDYYLKHIADSMLGLPYIKGKVLDIGSGAGFPAFVIKTELPETDITMVDSVGKKVTYLNEVIKKLGLESIKALHCRIEDIGRREYYDTVTARAVARLNVLAEYALPYLKKGGLLVAYKAADCDEEIKEAEYDVKLLGGKIRGIEEKKLDENTYRRIILIEKIGASPVGYPRKNNKPRLSPLTVDKSEK